MHSSSYIDKIKYLVYLLKWVVKQTLLFLFFSVTQTASPARPGSVTVNYINVMGGLLEQPELGNSSGPNPIELEPPGSGFVLPPEAVNSSSNPDYVMIWGRYRVIYTVRDCGNGMSLLQGVYQLQERDSQIARVRTKRIAMGSPPVSGTFGLSFGGKRIQNIPFDVSADILEMLLENNLVDEGGNYIITSIYIYYYLLEESSI